MAAIESTDTATLEHFVTEYSCALIDYISGAAGTALTRADELGRKALGNGLGVLELAIVHHEALRKQLDESFVGPGRDVVTVAARFLTQSLSHFDMALRLDDAVRKAKAAADDANRELDSLSYSVAHDLRAPLRSIDGFSEALLQDYSDRIDTGGQRYLRYLRESAQRMARLIDDLLFVKDNGVGFDIMLGSLHADDPSQRRCPHRWPRRFPQSAPMHIRFVAAGPRRVARAYRCHHGHANLRRAVARRPGARRRGH